MGDRAERNQREDPMNRFKREQLKKEQGERIQGNVLGDIRPNAPAGGHPQPSGDMDKDKHEESMEGGSRHDRTAHSGSRDVTEGTTGGTGTETGGSRNYRTGTG